MKKLLINLIAYAVVFVGLFCQEMADHAAFGSAAYWPWMLAGVLLLVVPAVSALRRFLTETME